MVVGFTTTYAISVYHHYSCEFESTHGDVNSIQYDVINFVSDLRQRNNNFSGSFQPFVLYQEKACNIGPFQRFQYFPKT